jgi:hypothetical protein
MRTRWSLAGRQRRRHGCSRRDRHYADHADLGADERPHLPEERDVFAAV